MLSPLSGMENIRRPLAGRRPLGRDRPKRPSLNASVDTVGFSSTSEVRIDELDPVPIADADFTIFLGIDKPPIMLDDQMAVIFAEKGNQGGNG